MVKRRGSKRDDRRARMKERIKRSSKNRDKKGLGRASVLDLSEFSNVKWYKEKAGKEKNLLDILPYEITQDWYKQLREFNGKPIGLEVGDLDYKLEVPVHQRIGEANASFLCLRLAFGKKCPICEDLHAEYNKPDDEQNDEVKRELTPRWRVFYNIRDLKADDPEEVILWEISYHLFEKELLGMAEPEDDSLEPEPFSDLEEGSSIEWKGKEKTLGKNKFIECADIDFVERDSLDEEEVLADVYPLDKMLVIPTYEDVQKAHLSLGDDEDIPPTGDEEGDEPPRKSGKKKRRRVVEEEEEEEAITECPEDGEFGKDFDQLEECEDCDEETAEACSLLYDKLKAKKKREKKGGKRRGRRPIVDEDDEDEDDIPF